MVRAKRTHRVVQRRTHGNCRLYERHLTSNVQSTYYEFEYPNLTVDVVADVCSIARRLVTKLLEKIDGDLFI